MPVEGMSPEAHRLLGVMALMVCLWITEAIPPPVTALLGPSLCVLAGIADVKTAFASFGDPIIFLLLGSFLLARAMLYHGLNRRIAFRILSINWIGGSPMRLMLAFGGTTAFISMWISNSATTAMMFPVALAILSEVARSQSARDGVEVDYRQLPYSTGLMLLTAFAASVGGLATPVGTPPNLIGLGMIEQHLKIELPFYQWMGFGIPLSSLMLGFLLIYLCRAHPVERQVLARAAHQVLANRGNPDPLQNGERNVVVAFGTTVFLWLLPAGVALIAGSDSAIYLWLRDPSPSR
jgi:sodium-dependent dicarboxylate transporter 2/3/5